MEIFILRHGQAEPWRADDETRQLVAEGRREVEQVVRGSSSDLGDVQAVLVSPYIRARQTVDVALPFLPRPTVKTCEWLTPSANPEVVVQRLALLDLPSVLLVSHQPLVGRLVELLCGLETGAVAMDTATLACLDVDVMAAGLAELRWVRHPDKP